MRKRRALLREVNELIRHEDGSGEPEPESLLLVCECESAECMGRLEVPASLYDEVRSDGERFIVIAGHEDDDVERVAATDGYSIVRVRSIPTPLTSAERPPPQGGLPQ